MDLTDEQWRVVKQVLADEPVRQDRRGRPWADQRTVLNGVLWLLRSGARWEDLPARYGSPKTVHRRFQQWARNGIIEKLLKTLAEDLHRRGKINPKESFMDAMFVSAKKGALKLEKQGGARGPKSWQWSTLMVFRSLFAQQAPLPMR
jgi:transposase